MASTTIKVPSELRDRLNTEARRTGGTVADVIESLFAESNRVERFRQMRMARARMSNHERTAGAAEHALWESAGLEALAASESA